MTLSTQNLRLTNARMTNFYYSFIFLPREKRQAIEAVYVFARRGDDLTDEHLSHAEAVRGVASYRQALDACFARRGGRLDNQPALQALAGTIERFKIPRQPFEDLILGLEMDLNSACYETFDDLALYCYRVASTIGLISIEIFGYRNARTRDYAVNLGMALQLTNILRDIQNDAERGRIYIPREDLERFGVRPADLYSHSYNDAFIELMQFEWDRARQYFDRARQMLAPEDRRSMVAAEIMAAIYWKILGRIQKRSYNVFGPRVRLSRPLKFWTALSVYLGAEWHS
jgi:phytoene synthase